MNRQNGPKPPNWALVNLSPSGNTGVGSLSSPAEAAAATTRPGSSFALVSYASSSEKEFGYLFPPTVRQAQLPIRPVLLNRNDQNSAPQNTTAANDDYYVDTVNQQVIRNHHHHHHHQVFAEHGKCQPFNKKK